ncbi:PHP-associated domain-containing protein [Halosegnis marinus]|uniref:PHP-associated domain-containing protein n=2 Tax=Halosegnis marinus TaxID=3034023 RepID=A0ABD5ZKX2_9EURY|nr:PHP-associated domain-containing protein [Halosegnis sp. DT85]
MLRVDLHAHTRFFHARPGAPTAFDPVGARLLAWYARRRGLDAVAVTNHDYRYDAVADGVTFLPGIEVSTTMGHVTVVGPDPPERTVPGTLTPEETVALAHDRGCVAVLAHPFRGSTARRSAAAFDAVECNGKHADTHAKARAVAERRGVPVVGGSDAHYPFEVGRGYTEVEGDEATPEAVVAAIREGRVDAAVHERRTDRALGPLYRAIHRTRGTR